MTKNRVLEVLREIRTEEKKRGEKRTREQQEIVREYSMDEMVVFFNEERKKRNRTRMQEFVGVENKINN